MPRKRKPARLWQRKDGRWFILDGGRQITTGLAGDCRDAAESHLAAFIADKQAGAPGRHSRSHEILIAEILRAYAAHHGPTVARPDVLADCVTRLTPFWAKRPASDIRGETCRAYAQSRGNRPTARRELETLRAAVNFWHREYGLDPVPAVTLPPKSAPRERWLTRTEAASLIRTVRAMREVQRGKATRRRTMDHLARFILIALYTGTRSGAVLSLGWHPSPVGGWVDLQHGLLYRRGTGQRRTNKRQPPVPLPNRLLAHLRRWHRLDHPGLPVVHYNGRAVKSVKRHFPRLVKSAGIKGQVTAHTLRHTAITWAMQQGHDMWRACGYFGVSMEVLQETYAHHHPDFLAEFRHSGQRNDTAMKQPAPTSTNGKHNARKTGI